jgi:hypothetical protein
MRRSSTLGLCALLASLALSSPGALRAIDAYVPLAAHLPLGAATYRTLVIVTNTGGAAAQIGVIFLPSGADGTQGSPQASFTVPAGSTLRLYDAVPTGGRGMLELTGPSGLEVSARIEAQAANGNLLASSELPVFTAANALGAGQHVELLGLETSANGPATDFGLLNLAGSPAHCAIQAFRSDGSTFGGAIRLTLPPRSNNEYKGALATLGQTAIRDSRFDVTCDQLFGTYALVYRSGGPETVALSPAARLDDDLKPDLSGGFTFNLPGQFANGTTYAAYDLALPTGLAYGHAHVEFDLYIDRWHTPFPYNPNYETVASFRRSASKRPDRVLYWGLILKGSGDYRTLLDIGPPPGVTEGTTVKSGKGPWQERTNYHLVMDYDAVAATVVFEAYQGGALVQRLTGAANNLDISNLPNQLIRVDFSAPGVGDGAYFPTLGWKYSNLAVRLTPRSK